LDSSGGELAREVNPMEILVVCCWRKDFIGDDFIIVVSSSSSSLDDDSVDCRSFKGSNE